MTRLARATNVAIILACLLLTGSWARNYFLSSKPDPRIQPDIPKGAKVNLPGLIPGSQQSALPTLVLVLSKNCHFCTESAPFYQKLTAFKNSFPQGLRFIAVLPESKDEAENYLKEYGIRADAVLSMSISQIGAQGTPALVLLDGQNKLEEIWVGKLSNSQEEQVMARLKKACGGMCNVRCNEVISVYQLFDV
jgi:hypothetical protein